MQIEIFEPELVTRRGFNGFYAYFLSALTEHAAARTTDDPRPVPRLLKPREHESCWIRCDGKLVFFDMSDHIQLLDVEALKVADIYFKANLHRGVARRVLTAVIPRPFVQLAYAPVCCLGLTVRRCSPAVKPRRLLQQLWVLPVTPKWLIT